MAAPGWRHGSPIHRVKDENGKDVATSLRYLSPSAMKLFDPQSEGCPRKWAWQYLAGKKEPETQAQRTGTELHAEIENYLQTGSRNMSALALSGLHMLPLPGPDLLVESEMSWAFTDPETKFAVEEAWALREAGDLDGAAEMLRNFPILTAGGVPIIGRIDLMHDRGTNQGTEDVEDAYDPPGTVEVIDQKTSSDIARWGKTSAELGRDLQMLAYAAWVLHECPDVQFVRLSHCYFQTKGTRKTRKVSILLDRATILARWEYADGLARRIVDAARKLDPNDVEANPNACDRFGGCPHRAYCNVVRPGIRGLFATSKTTNAPASSPSKLRNALSILKLTK